MRGLDYNDPKWNDLLDQLIPSDYQTLITQSGYGTAAIKSVDKLLHDRSRRCHRPGQLWR